jgi:spore germination protein YaaH
VRPVPKHELYGFVPYWEMTDGIAAHLAKTPLTTLALFSVTHTKSGKIDTSQTGYKRITGPIGTRLISEAQDRDVAVELVYTSFGTARNARFFGSMKVQDATIASLVSLADRIGVDGIDVDVERLDVDLVPAYGAFVGRLREALRAKVPDAQVSVSTTGGRTGAAMALSATTAGADRVFLMGYDYHYAGSDVGASAPMDRRDGSDADLPWSLDLYAAVGVPADRTILGLPLYGMRWRVAGPEIGAPRLGDGAIWVPADNPKFLADPPAPPLLDDIEIVDVYVVAPTVSPEPGDSRATAGWQAIYVDSPETLRTKLALADERGLAGAGFWAIGYERSLPGYRDLMKDFTAGKVDPTS